MSPEKKKNGVKVKHDFKDTEQNNRGLTLKRFLLLSNKIQSRDHFIIIEHREIRLSLSLLINLSEEMEAEGTRGGRKN